MLAYDDRNTNQLALVRFTPYELLLLKGIPSVENATHLNVPS